MRRKDKYRNIEQANLMLENSYLKSKGFINEFWPFTKSKKQTKQEPEEELHKSHSNSKTTLSKDQRVKDLEKAINLFKDWLKTQKWITVYDEEAPDRYSHPTFGEINDQDNELNSKVNLMGLPIGHYWDDDKREKFLANKFKSDDPNLQKDLDKKFKEQWNPKKLHENLRKFVKDKFETSLKKYVEDKGLKLEFSDDCFQSMSGEGGEDGIYLSFWIYKEGHDGIYPHIEGSIDTEVY